jgi:hypothetical protein
MDDDYALQDWITCGELEIRSPHSHTGIITVGAHLANATDYEHSSSWAFLFNLFALNYKFVSDGWTYFDGVLAFPRNRREFRDFRVPDKDYDFFEGSTKCDSEYCDRKGKHRITDYLPPENPELFKIIGGRNIDIRFGPTGNE